MLTNLRLAQIYAVLRLELKKTFFARRGLWIYLLAFAPVHEDGLGAQAGKPTDNDVWLTIGFGAALAFVLLLGKGLFVALLAPVAAMAAAWFASRWIAERIGGYTGDTLGAVQQKAETVFLVVAALMIGQ